MGMQEKGRATRPTAGEALLFVGVEGSVFATTADAYARWTCRNVP
jgi:hypothetical protein